MDVRLAISTFYPRATVPTPERMDIERPTELLDEIFVFAAFNEKWLNIVFGLGDLFPTSTFVNNAVCRVRS